MTKKLNELFDLAESNGVDMTQEEMREGIRELDTIDTKMKEILDLTASDKEMDELAAKAMQSFDDFVDLAMNVEIKAAAPILEAATKLMGHAIAAKAGKIDKKIRLLDLEIKQRRLAHQIEMDSKSGKGNDDVVEGDATILDRNSLLEMLRSKDA